MQDEWTTHKKQPSFWLFFYKNPWIMDLCGLLDLHFYWVFKIWVHPIWWLSKLTHPSSRVFEPVARQLRQRRRPTIQRRGRRRHETWHVQQASLNLPVDCCCRWTWPASKRSSSDAWFLGSDFFLSNLQSPWEHNWVSKPLEVGQHHFSTLDCMRLKEVAAVASKAQRLLGSTSLLGA